MKFFNVLWIPLIFGLVLAVVAARPALALLTSSSYAGRTICADDQGAESAVYRLTDKLDGWLAEDRGTGRYELTVETSDQIYVFDVSVNQLFDQNISVHPFYRACIHL